MLNNMYYLNFDFDYNAVLDPLINHFWNMGHK